jgi:hypothetical protein
METEAFVDTLENEATVYAVVCDSVVASEHSLDANSSRSLSSFLKEIHDVFSEEEAGRLPLHRVADHAIELNGRDSPFGILFALCILTIFSYSRTRRRRTYAM